MTTDPTRAAEIVVERKALIDAIISMYHTTRLRDCPVADHILSKHRVQEAFSHYEASLRPTDTARAGGVEHAFRAGFAAAEQALGTHGSDHLLAAIESAWAEYRLDNPATPSPVTETALSGEIKGPIGASYDRDLECWTVYADGGREILFDMKGYSNPRLGWVLSALRSLASTPQPAAAETDARLLDVLRDESWDLRCFNIPTGGGDADIGWRVIGHWMAEPCERVMGEVFHDDPRAAIRAAIRQSAKGGE